LYSIDDVLHESSPEWRIERLLPVGALSMIYAPQEQFKTFFGLDLALSVAYGLDFHGRRVKQGPTIYVLGEGRGGLKNRILAWMQEHDIVRVPSAFFVLEAVQFNRRDDVQKLRAQIDSLNVEPAMLFIDTFARCAVGVDENDAMHVGTWIDAVTGLQHSMRVDVVALHHAQKGSNDGGPVRERGSSAFIGAVDTVIRLAKKSQKVKVTCEKQKDAEHFAPFTLAVRIMPLGTNEHGEAASSCVLVDPEDPGAERNQLGNGHRVMLSSLSEFPDQTASRGEWVQKTGIKERTFDRYRNELVTQGYIESSGRGVFRITGAGRLAIANPLPTSRCAETTQLVAAKHPPPGRGGVATGLATTNQDSEPGPQQAERSDRGAALDKRSEDGTDAEQ
jgi:hypothetical protein